MVDVSLGNVASWAVQIAAIGLAGVLLPLLLGVTSPRARLVYLRMLLVACLALPLIQPWVPVATPAAPTGTTVASEDLPLLGGASGPAVSSAAGPVGSVPSRRWPLETLLLVVYVSGVAIRLAWLGLGLLSLSRLRRSSSAAEPRPAAVSSAVDLVGVDADFLVSSRVVRPVTFGLRRPVVLVPPGFLAFAPEQQTAVAAHELLHVARRDWALALGDELVLSVCWFHPALWWLVDQIHLSVEQVVDSAVVQLVGARKPYLEALLKLAAAGPMPMLQPASAILKHGHLAQRVAALVREASMSRLRLAASFVVVLAVLAIGGWWVVRAFPLTAAFGPVVLPTPPELMAYVAAPPPPPPPRPAAPKAHADQAAGQQTRPTVPAGAQASVPGAAAVRGGLVEWPSPVALPAIPYPERALAERRGGIVGVQVQIDRSGSVTYAKISYVSWSSNSDVSRPSADASQDLTAAALDAARQLRFAPMSNPPASCGIGIKFDPATGKTEWLPVPPPPPPPAGSAKTVYVAAPPPAGGASRALEPLDPAEVAKLRASIQAAPGEPSFYYALAFLYERAGDVAEAGSLMVQARDAAPRDPKVWLQLAGFYNRQGNFEKTIDALVQRAANDPNNPDAPYTLATYYWDKAYRDTSVSPAEKGAYVQKGLGYVDTAIRMKPEYMEALTYKNLLLRLQATLEADPARQQALIAEADQLRNEAIRIKNARQKAATEVPFPAFPNAVRYNDPGVTPPRVVSEVKPYYGGEAYVARVEGTVIVEGVVGTDGKVADARVVRSIPLLDRAALDAARQWIFEPGLRGGVAVPTIVTIDLTFTRRGPDSAPEGH